MNYQSSSSSAESSKQIQFTYPTYEEFLNDFEPYHSKLGKGTYGTVYKWPAKKPLDGTNYEYAVKIIEAKTQKSFEQCQKEFLILRSLPKHPGIVNFIKSYAWQQVSPPAYHLCLVMELADRNLQQEIDTRKLNNNYFNDSEFFNILQQSVETFYFISREKKIYHRDIKPENIMYAKKNSTDVKITDFGVSRQLIEDKLTLNATLVGTPVYLSPILWQTFERENFDINRIGKINHNVEKSDVYSLGVSMLQTALLLKNEVVGLNSTDKGIQKTNDLLKGIINPKIRQILSLMLDHDENKRISYKELMDQFFPNPFFPDISSPLTSQQRSLRWIIWINQYILLVLILSRKIQFLRIQKRKVKIILKWLALKIKIKSLFHPQRSLSLRYYFVKNTLDRMLSITVIQITFLKSTLKFFYNSLICEDCSKQLNSKEYILVSELKNRAYGIQYNKFLKQKIMESESQLKIISQQILTSMQLEVEAIIHKIREIGTSLRSQKNYGESISQDILQINDENENLIQLIASTGNKAFDSQLIKQILKKQHAINQKNFKINEEIAGLMKRKEQIIQEYKNSLMQKVFEKFKTDSFAYEIKGIQHKFSSDKWKILNNSSKNENLLELNHQNEKIQLKCQNIINTVNQILVFATKNDQIYYQTTDLNFFKQPLISGQTKSLTKQLQLKDEQITCFDFFDNEQELDIFNSDSLIFGTKSGKIMRLLQDDHVELLHSKDQPISYIQQKKQFIIFGLAKGLIYDYDPQMKTENKYQSRHTTEITGFAFFDNLRCFISSSLYPYLNVQYKNQLEEFDTQLSQVSQLWKVQNSQIVTFDQHKCLVKFWTLSLRDEFEQKIDIKLTHIIDLMTQYQKMMIFSNLMIVVGSNYIKGYFQNSNEFNLEHQMTKNYSKVCCASQENYLAYSQNDYIFVWKADIQFDDRV